MEFVNLAEAEALAREKLPLAVYDYFAGGAMDEVTLVENRRAYDQLALRPRVLVDVSRVDVTTTLLGRRVPSPILVAPMAMQKMAHPDGELATARAASATGAGMVVSTLSTQPVEAIADVSAQPPWFQLYIYKDRGITHALVERVAAAGYGALVLTVDTPLLGRRERDVRGAFRPPPGIAVANTVSTAQVSTLVAVPAGSALSAYFHGTHDPSVSWRDLEWLRGLSALPLVLKGVLRRDDARRAVDHGADAIVVSNHGGRQLDTAFATIRALPEIAAEAGGGIDVLIDGGIRRGTDVLKAIALGARGVLVGRPLLWGLTVAGESGATRVLRLLRDELELAMALCGASDVSALTPDLVVTSEA